MIEKNSILLFYMGVCDCDKCFLYHKLKELLNGTTLALGSRPRQRGSKVAGQEGDPGIISHAPGSAKSVRV
jgi:hypothetical protein